MHLTGWRFFSQLPKTRFSVTSLFPRRYCDIQERKSFREEREERLGQLVEERIQQTTRTNTLYPPLPFNPTHTIESYRNEFMDKLKAGEKLENTEIIVCGRIYTKRHASKKLLFIDIGSNGSNIQIMASLSSYKPSHDQAIDFNGIISTLNRGDIIGLQSFF